VLTGLPARSLSGNCLFAAQYAGRHGHALLGKDAGQISDLLRRSRLVAVGFPARRKWFLVEGHSRFGRHAARGRLDEPVGELLLLAPQSLK
jgi:hypothetical protein